MLLSVTAALRSVLPYVVLLLIGAGCASESPSQAEPPAASESVQPTAAASSTGDPLAAPTIEGLFEVAADGRRLNLACWGDGTPTVVLESGHPDGAGVADYGATEYARLLAARTRVCAYDRAGWGESDPAPNEARDADDVVADLAAVLHAADVSGPYVLAGSSFGGMIVTHFAQRHPDDVAGVVVLDTPAPDATLSPADIPEIAWDHPANPEHVNVGPAFENRFARRPATFKAPLLVVTATGGDSSAADQRVWLRSSPQSRQVELEGGHEIYLDAPAEVAAEVTALLDVP